MDWNEFLHEAIAEKHADLINEALAQGADPNHPEALGGAFAGTTPLHWAVFGGDLRIVRLLLDAGARVTAEAGAESSSLHVAAEDVNLPMVDLLLGHDGAAALDWFDYVSRTPLMIAVEVGSVQIARRLIDAGADVNAHDEPCIGGTALHLAAANGTLEIVTLLLGAGADPTISTGLAGTPLDKARGRKRGEGPAIYEKMERAARRSPW